MTTKTLTAYVAAGYALSSAYTGLRITATGGVGGTGVFCADYAAVTNAGRIDADATHVGLHLAAAGSVLNQAGGLIGGYAGIGAYAAPAVVTNYGTIEGTGRYAIRMFGGGTLQNGGYDDFGGLIAGQEIALGPAGVVANFGVIDADIVMAAGGTVTNGAVYDTAALLDHAGGVDIFGGQASVANFGTIQGVQTYAVNLGVGGSVTNGSAADTVARIAGRTGVQAYGAQATVVNFGAVVGRALGVFLNAGGSVTNGSGADPGARIEGYTGVEIQGAPGTVVNFGVVQGTGSSLLDKGVYLRGGGRVTNGGGADRSAVIEGHDGVAVTGGGSVENFATVLATGAGGAGVSLDTGVVTNGSATNGAALIEGYVGVALVGLGAMSNFATVWGVGDHGGAGAALEGGGALVNGDATHPRATIEGFYGVQASGGATVTNFGTIDGEGGAAVEFGAATDVLVVEAASTFLGAIDGGGGTLDLASGVGKLTGLLSAAGDVTVSGSMAATTFQDFATVEVGAGARFTQTGAVSLAAGRTVDAAGTLTLGGPGKNGIVNAGLIETTGAGVLSLAGAVANTGTIAAEGGAITVRAALSGPGRLAAAAGGTLTVTGAVTGLGTATIAGGTLDFAAGFKENVTFTKAGVLELAQSQGYAGTITGFSHTGGTSLDLGDIGFVGAGEATFSGTRTGGVLTVTDGTHTARIDLKGDYASAGFVASSDGHGGTKVVDPAGPGAAHGLIAAMAGWGASAGGAVAFRESSAPREALLARP